MKGVVVVDERHVVHVIPRDEIRYIEVAALDGDGWALKYQLAGVAVVRSVEWRGDCRPASLKTSIAIGAYNEISAHGLLTILTRGHRDVHLERRTDKVFLVRSGLVEEDAQVVLCRNFISSTAVMMAGSWETLSIERQRELLEQIRAAARNLVLPEGFTPAESA